jgi:predicted secreted protein
MTNGQLIASRCQHTMTGSSHTQQQVGTTPHCPEVPCLTTVVVQEAAGMEEACWQQHAQRGQSV